MKKDAIDRIINMLKAIGLHPVCGDNGLALHYEGIKDIDGWPWVVDIEQVAPYDLNEIDYYVVVSLISCAKKHQADIVERLKR